MTDTLRSLADLASLLPADYKPPEEKSGGKGGHDGKGKPLHVNIEKSGRKGKIVTVIGGFQHNPDTMEEIARTLKQQCGAGGTVKGMTIEIQGDNRERAKEILRAMNYKLK